MTTVADWTKVYDTFLQTERKKDEILIRTRKEKAQEKKSESKSKTQDSKREQAKK